MLIPEVSPAMKSRDYKGVSSDGDGDGLPLIVHALRADGFDASEDGTGRGVPLIAGPLTSHPYPGSATEGPIAFSANMTNPTAGDQAPTLRAMPSKKNHPNGGHQIAVAYDMRGREGGAQFEGPHDTANIRSSSGGSSRSYVAPVAGTFPSSLRGGGPGTSGDDAKNGMDIVTRYGVRRLTPRECERLQGFPDDYTLIPYNKKMAKDGPRYKALGNSMAVPVMRWIGDRIELVEREAGGLQTMIA